MRKGIVVITAVLSLAALLVPALASAAGKDVTLKGEVIGLDCYMAKGAHGADHQSCAMMCLNDDGPVGLLTASGKAYFLISDTMDKAKDKAYHDLRAWAAEQAKITGVLYQRGGLSCVLVDTAKKL